MATPIASRLALAVVLLAAPALAGCASDDGDDVPEDPYQMGAQFTENGTEEDGRALAEELEAYGAQVGFLESDPPQVIIRGFVEEDCGEITSVLENKTYIATISDCVPINPPEDGDAPDSNGSNGIRAER